MPPAKGDEDVNELSQNVETEQIDDDYQLHIESGSSEPHVSATKDKSNDMDISLFFSLPLVGHEHPTGG